MMMKGVLHLKPALQKIKFDMRERDGPLEVLIPDDDEFQLIAKIVPLLTSIEKISVLLSGNI